LDYIHYREEMDKIQAQNCGGQTWIGRNMSTVAKLTELAADH
jgi:hypothetical protein